MKPVIRLEHIEKVFHDGKDDFEALRDVSLDSSLLVPALPPESHLRNGASCDMIGETGKLTKLRGAFL